MRLIVTADLHYNHSRSRASADALIDRINAEGGDVLLLVGDTAVGDGDDLERCLGRFRFDGPRLFVAGNHELWTRRGDSYALFTDELPRRVRSAGWQWLENDSFIAGDVAIVGSVGWYDYAYAPISLGVPRRFYQAKVSPGAAQRLGGYEHLFEPDDLLPQAMEIVARWNDGQFVQLGRSDEAFLDELLRGLEKRLAAVASCDMVVAAIHHVPFSELLPASHGHQWGFAKAYLGSPRIGELLRRFANVGHVFCGHSHVAARARLGPIQAINIGSGYGQKRLEILDV